ncbi:MAG: hypothetical protein GX984_06685 [Erysipelothrix sp.]|nr:hypothetical protein [Erysipelothrix sp.]
MLYLFFAIIVGTVYVNDNKVSLKNLYIKTFQASGQQTVKSSMPLPNKSFDYQIKLMDSVFIEVPLIAQLPKLPRGCEVTSLAMLLNHHQIEVDKMELAEKIKRDPATYEVIDGKIHFGNPYNGFVGDMYSFNTPGLGVYHKPIAELAAEYVGLDRVYDFTGQSFSEIFNELNKGRPVWVIINADYKELPKESFITWQTNDGPIDVTMRQHSVLITGYDQEYIYFNDPLKRQKKAPIDDFQASWIQMGKQALTIY